MYVLWLHSVSEMGGWCFFDSRPQSSPRGLLQTNNLEKLCSEWRQKQNQQTSSYCSQQRCWFLPLWLEGFTFSPSGGYRNVFYPLHDENSRRNCFIAIILWRVWLSLETLIFRDKRTQPAEKESGPRTQPWGAVMSCNTSRTTSGHTFSCSVFFLYLCCFLHCRCTLNAANRWAGFIELCSKERK